MNVTEIPHRPSPLKSAQLEAWIDRHLATVGLRPSFSTAEVLVPKLPEGSADRLGRLHCSEYRGDEGHALGLAITLDSRSVISHHKDGKIRNWLLTDGVLRWAGTINPQGTADVAISPVGSTVAIGASHGPGLTLLDTGTGRVLWSREEPAWMVFWSHDGKRLLTHDGTLHDSATGQIVARSGQRGLTILPDGRTLQMIDKVLVVCNSLLEAQQTIPQVTNPFIARVSPQLDRVAVYADDPKEVWIFSLPGMQPVQSWSVLRERGNGRGLVWSPDGEHLATSIQIEDCVRIWNSRTGELVHEFRLSIRYAWRLAWAPNSAFLAAGCDDTIEFFDTRPLMRHGVIAANRSPLKPEHRERTRHLTGFHRLGLYPPLSTAESALQIIAGNGPDPVLAAEPGIQLLSDLHWNSSARMALASLLLENIPFPGWTPPDGVSHREISETLQHALASAEPVTAEGPALPVSAIVSAAKQISESFVRMLELIGESAISEEPSIVLRLLRHAPKLPHLPSPKLWRWSERSFSQQGGHSIAMTSLGDRGGFGPHGDIRSLLPSQWVLPEDVMTYRFLHQELLYRQRLSNAPPRVRPLVVMLDISAATFGAIEAITRPLAHAALNRAYEAGVPASLVLVGASTRVVPIQRRRDFVEIWINRGEPLAAATHGLHTAQRTRETWTTNSEEGIILVLSHAWFGADETLPAIPGLRALFVQYPGAKVTPQFPCEAWHTVDSHQPTTMWAKLAELLA